MIFTEKKITINNNECKMDSPVVLYRGDYNVEVRFTIVSSPYKYSNKQETNVIEQTEASYGQLVIKTPGDKAPIFSEITATKRGAITFTITAEMIDEVNEIGDYTFQIRLLDENKESRATIPEVVNGIEIREPIAAEHVSTTNEVGVATVGYALTTTGTPEDVFDTQGNYNKTTWGTGDRITAAKLNKMEAGIDGVNKKVASGGTGSNNAGDISIADTGNYFTSTNVEGALQEAGSQIKDIPNGTVVEEGKLYLIDKEKNKLDNGTVLPISDISTSGIAENYKIEKIGELFEQPAGYNYLAWPAGNLRYDKKIDRFVLLVNCADKHLFTTLDSFLYFINPKTFEIEEIKQINLENTKVEAICNLWIFDDGTYMIFKRPSDVYDKNNRYISTDNGSSWTKTGTISCGYHFWSMDELYNNRLIMSCDDANRGFYYSDDNGITWSNVKPSGSGGTYNAEFRFVKLGENRVMALGRKNMGGTGDPALISYSYDNGATWSEFTDSTSITDMNSSNCTAIVHDNMVEIFAASRWYDTTSMYTNTGKYGAINHYVATVENALLDKFTFKGTVAYSNGVGTGDIAQDFHCICSALDSYDNALFVYFDRSGDGSAASTNYYFLRGNKYLNSLIKDDISNKIFTYSSYKIDNIIKLLKADIITTVNEAIMNNQPIPPDISDPDVPTSYVFDSLICNFNFVDSTKFDTTNMTVADSINTIKGTYTTSANSSATPVDNFVEVHTNNVVDNTYFYVPSNTLNTHISDENNFEFSFEFSFYVEETLANYPELFLLNGWTPRILSNILKNITFYNTSSSVIQFTKNYEDSSVYTAPKLKDIGLHHFIFTFNSSGEIRCYYNNKLVNSYTMTDFTHWDINILKNGFYLLWTKKAFRVYAKALTQEEVAINFNYEKNTIK